MFFRRREQERGDAGRTAFGSGHSAANSRRREIVEFTVDGPAYDRTLGLVDETVDRVQGAGQPAYIGAESDPSQAFYGYAPAQQSFTGAAAGARNPVLFRDPSQGTFETGRGDNALDDPVQRILAEKLRRRR